MRALLVTIACAVVAVLVAFGALADAGSGCSTAGGAQYDQYGNLLPPCSSGGSQYGQYGSGGSQYGQYGAGGAQYGQYGGSGGSQFNGPFSAYAQESRLHETDVTPGVDAISAAASTIGWRGWSGTLGNFSASSALPDPSIQLDGVSPSWTFTPPAGPFPLTHTQASLAPNSAMGLDALDGFGSGTSRVNGASMATGYDASRSVSVTSNPDGSSTAHVSVTLTAVDARWLNQYLTVSVSFNTDTPIDAASVVFPDTSDGAFTGFTTVQSTFVQWQMSNPTLGHPYTLTLDVNLPAGTTNTAAFRPAVQFYGSVGSGLSSSSGSSVTIPDAELGGTWSFSTGATASWTAQVFDAYILNFPLNEATPPPAAQATDQRMQFQDLGSNVDSVGATDSVLGERAWRATIQNFNQAPVTAPAISIDTSSQTFTPAVTFPISVGPGSDLGQGQALDLNRLSNSGGGNSSVLGATTQTGYDASRSFDTTAIPAGGGSQTVTVNVTPQDASYEGGSVELHVAANSSGGSAASIDIAGVTMSPLTHGEYTFSPFLTSGDADWKIFAVHVGETYTLTVPIHVDNPGASSFSYKPAVFVYGFRDANPAPAVGTSTTIADPVLGGTVTFSSSSAVQWTRDLEDLVSTSFEPIQPPMAPTASATDYRSHVLQLPGTTDTVDGSVAQAGYEFWDPSIYNGGSATVPSPQIVAASTRGSDFTPTVTFPFSASGPDLSSGNPSFDLNALSNHQLNGASVTPGYDLARTMSPATLPSSGGVQHETVSITANDPRYATGSIDISVNPSACCQAPAGFNPTIDPATVVFPALSGSAQDSVAPNDLYWAIGSPVVGHTYTLSFDIVVPAFGSTDFAYKPYVQASGWVFAQLPDSTGNSTVITDPELGGTVTFSSSAAVHWYSGIADNSSVRLAELDPQAPPAAAAQVSRTRTVLPGAGADSYTAGQTVPGTLTWNAYLFNQANTPLPAPAITATSSTLSFLPAVTFPHIETGADLGQYGSFTMNGLGGPPGGSHVSVASSSAGVDLARSASSPTVAPGGSTITETVSLTPRDPGLAGQYVYVDVFTDTLVPGATVVPGSLVGPAADPSAATDAYAGTNEVYWSAPATVGTTYTLTFQIQVPNAGGVPLTYKPDVSGGWSVDSSLGAAPDGPSTTIADSVLGGAFSFSTGLPSISWPERDLFDQVAVDLAPVSQPVVAVDHFTVSASPSSVSADHTFTVTITARDASNHTVHAYAGPVTLTDSSGTLAMSAPASWTNGVGTATVSVHVPFTNDRITAVDGAGSSPPATGTSGAVTIVGPVDHFVVQLSSAAVNAGSPFQVTVKAIDVLGHVVTGYAGPIVLNDLSGALAVSSPGVWVHGVATATVSVGVPYHHDAISALDGSGLTTAAGTSGNLNVLGAVDHFTVGISPTTFPVGSSAALTVTAKDALNDTVVGFAGPVALTDDLGGIAPGAVTWTNGVGHSTAAFGVIGRDRVTAASGTATGTSGYLTVYGALDHFVVSVAPGTFAAGADATLTVTAKDSANDTVPTYSGTPTLTDTSGSVATDGAWSWTNGVGHVPVLVSTPTRSDRITATDGAAAGTSGALNVYGPVSSFRVALSPSPVAVGAALAVTATALDVNGLTVPSYAGPVTVSDTNASPPTVSTAFAWTNGVGHGSVQIGTATHLDRLTVADGTVAGQSATFNVLGPVTHFKVTASPASILVTTQQLTVTTTAQDAANNTIVAYSGPVVYADANGTSTVHVVSESWTNGIDTAKVTISTARTGDTMRVSDAGSPGIFGVSNTFTVHH